jgi:Spy/CpxP family protein refolding chaperone
MSTKLKSWLVLGLVFVAGFGAGVVVTRGVVRHLIQQAVTNPDRVRDVIERRLVRQLDLTPVQRGQVHAILLDTQKDLHALRGEFRPQFVAILSNAEQRVGAVLTDEQRARLAEFQAENRRFWEPSTRP